MLCEICGKNEAKFIVEIEGAEMNACIKCGRKAKIIGKIEKEDKTGKSIITENTKLKDMAEEERIIDNYGKVIKEARIKAGISLEELGRELNEKESYLRHIEREEMLPNDKLIKKLEKKLKIKLKEKVETPIENIKGEVKREESLEDVAEIEGEL